MSDGIDPENNNRSKWKGSDGFTVTSYPAARRGDDADEYHGESAADPYRWLEVHRDVGHSRRGKPAAKAIAEAADTLAFLEGALGIAVVQQ